MRLKQAANWNQTEADWLALFAASPNGCFGYAEHDRILSTCTAVVEDGLAWIGMVLTAPEARGRGLATALLHHTLAWLDESGIAASKLDATVQGEPLYRKLGFVPECPIERWSGQLPASEVAPSGRYAGAKRMAPFPRDAEAECKDGWATGRAGANAWYFGPCRARTPEAAAHLARALAGGRGPCFWDLLPHHPAANVARELGFAPSRTLLRMVRGQAPPTPADTYAIAGFEWG